MSKKDYILLAQALKHTRPSDAVTNDAVYHALLTWNKTVDLIASELAKDNPRFNRAKFLEACGYNK